MPDKWSQYEESPSQGDKWAQYVETPAQQPPTPDRPTGLQRFSEVTTGSQHPIADTRKALGYWADHPMNAAADLAIDTAMFFPRMAQSLMHPIDTAIGMTGGDQFSEDIQNKNYSGALGSMAGGITNALPFLLGGEAAGNTALRGAQDVTRASTDFTKRAYTNTKDALGRSLRIEPTPGTPGELKSESTLKPGVRAVSGIAGVFGGPKIVNALAPDHPLLPTKITADAQEAALAKNAQIDATTQSGQKTMAAAHEQMMNDLAEQKMRRQAAQDRLDSDANRSSQKRMRLERQEEMKQGSITSQELQYAKELEKKHLDAAEMNRQRDAAFEKDQISQLDQGIQDAWKQRQGQLADRGRLNNSYGDALNRRGGYEGAISGELHGKPTPFEDPDLEVIPEPRPTLRTDKPGAKWSVERGSELTNAAHRGEPGAGEVLQNVGKKRVIYIPRKY